MGMELHARARRDLEPDPEFDPICALFYCLSSDAPLPNVDSTQLTGAIMVDKDYQSCNQGKRWVWNHSLFTILYTALHLLLAIYYMANAKCVNSSTV